MPQNTGNKLNRLTTNLWLLVKRQDISHPAKHLFKTYLTEIELLFREAYLQHENRWWRRLGRWLWRNL